MLSSLASTLFFLEKMLPNVCLFHAFNFSENTFKEAPKSPLKHHSHSVQPKNSPCNIQAKRNLKGRFPSQTLSSTFKLRIKGAVIGVAMQKMMNTRRLEQAPPIFVTQRPIKESRFFSLDTYAMAPSESRGGEAQINEALPIDPFSERGRNTAI